VLGDPNEDGTLVYLWLRPIARWRIVAAAVAATLSVTLPVVVVPMVLAAMATGAGSKLVAGTIAACVVATLAYTGIFTWVGLRMKRSFMWGLAYILIWEGFVASAGKNSARLAVRAHAKSLLSRIADGPERLIEVTATTAVVVPLLAGAVAIWFTVRRLTRQDVA
jgi:ABC-2 type transport system permease protein